MLISPFAMSVQVWKATEENLPLRGAQFRGQRFEIRDDQLLKRYVPEFNGITGQTWLAARHVIPSLKPPWASLHNDRWTNSNVPARLEWHLGHKLRAYGVSDRSLVLLYYMCFTIFIVLLVRPAIFRKVSPS